MACTGVSVIENGSLTVRNLENSYVGGLLHLQWHCNIHYKIRLSLLSELMYVTSLSVDGFEYYLAISFSSTHTMLCRIIKLCLITQKC